MVCVESYIRENVLPIRFLETPIYHSIVFMKSYDIYELIVIILHTQLIHELYYHK
jgi:hypothetical protein